MARERASCRAEVLTMFDVSECEGVALANIVNNDITNVMTYYHFIRDLIQGVTSCSLPATTHLLEQ
jgi:hypothetical protein